MPTPPFRLPRAKGAGGQLLLLSSHPTRGLLHLREHTFSVLRVAGGDHGQGLHRHVQGVSTLYEHHVLTGRALQKNLVGEFLGTRTIAVSFQVPVTGVSRRKGVRGTGDSGLST